MDPAKAPRCKPQRPPAVTDLSSAVIFGGANGIGKGISDYLRAQTRMPQMLVSVDSDPSFPDAAITNPETGDFRLCVNVTEPAKLASVFSGLKPGSLEAAFLSVGIQDDSQPELTDQVNVQGTRNCFQSILPYLKSGALVVFLSSDLITWETESISPYVRSKKAVAEFAKQLAGENRELRILTLLPGPVDTALFRTGKGTDTLAKIEVEFGIMTPDEFARKFFDEVLPSMGLHGSGAAVRMYKKAGIEWLKGI